ncbi:MAG: septum formation initiator family protein [bacterium]
MEKKRQRGNRQAWLKRMLMAAAFVLCFLYFIFSFGRLHYYNYLEQRNLAAVKEENKQLKQKAEMLRGEKKNFLDLDYLKDYARRKLFIMDKDEVPIRIINSPKEDVQSGGEKEETDKNER